MTETDAQPDSATPRPVLDARILRLVRGSRERRAIQAGHVDAIVDPATGSALLLPGAQAALLESRARLRSLLELSADGYWEQDEQFCFSVQRGMSIGGGAADGSDMLGRPLWDLSFENSSEIDWQTYRTQLEWRSIIRDLKLRFVDGAGRMQGVRISGEPMFDTQGRFKGYCGIVQQDATCGEPAVAAQRAGHSTQAALDALVVLDDPDGARRAEQCLRLEYTVARALAAAGNIDTGLQSVLRAIGEVQHWERGRYFRFDAASGQLVLEQSWGESAEAMEQVQAASQPAVSAPGAGLGGRACQSRRPQWVLDVPRDPAAVQKSLPHETDLGGAFVFPVFDAEGLSGVLAFASHTVRAPDEHLLQTVRSIGEQVGQFLRRRQAEEVIRQREAQCRSLLDLSVDWVWEQDAEFRYSRLDGAGMACIKGLLGATLWEVPGIAVDDNDEWIKHKSEIAAQWSFCDLRCTVRQADGRLEHYCISGAPTYSEAGVFTGFHGTGLDVTRSAGG